MSRNTSKEQQKKHDVIATYVILQWTLIAPKEMSKVKLRRIGKAYR